MQQQFIFSTGPNASPLPSRHGVNSIGIDYLKKMELENFEFELKFATKKLKSQINLPFNFLFQKYFFYDNRTWNINYSK